MRRVLIIAYLYAPPKASKRLPGLANHLPEHGWEPIVMTAPLPEPLNAPFEVVETGYRDALGFWKKLFRVSPNGNIRSEFRSRLGVTARDSVLDRVLTLCAAWINYPDSERGWKRYGIEAGSDLVRRGGIDAMISIYPITSRLIARALKEKYRIPWVADFPDLWTQNHNYYYGRLRKLVDRRLEVRTIARADALVTTSEPWAEKLRSLHKREDVFPIPLGYGPGEVNSPRSPLTQKFTITYTGIIYQGKQNPSKLFSALRKLIGEGVIDPRDLEVRLYGPQEKWIEDEVRLYGLRGIVNQYGLVPRAVALAKQKESQVLLLLNWDDGQDTGCHTGKIFEYLASYRPILSVGGCGRDVVKEVLEETGSGTYARTEADVAAALRLFYAEYEATGRVASATREDAIEKYSHREMARKFAAVLDRVTNRERVQPAPAGRLMSRQE